MPTKHKPHQLQFMALLGGWIIFASFMLWMIKWVGELVKM